ncbi:hypothetical protein GCM10009738_60700 [Kitasatospora viridis]
MLCCLAVFLSAGLLGFLPPLLLAVRRRSRADWAGLVVVCLVEVGMLVCAGVAKPNSADGVANGVGMGLMVLMMFGGPVHFLLMNRRSVWARRAPVAAAPYPAAPQYGPGPVPMPVPMPSPYSPVPTAVPVPPAPPVPTMPSAPTTPSAPSAPVDDLRQLGELLRRQAGGDQR